jgi:hypothetical protein
MGNNVVLRTSLFNLRNEKMTDLASLIGLSLSQVYRIKNGERGINEKFITGTLTAFPQYKFEDLFYIQRSKEAVIEK